MICEQSAPEIYDFKKDLKISDFNVIRFWGPQPEATGGSPSVEGPESPGTPFRVGLPINYL